MSEAGTLVHDLSGGVCTRRVRRVHPTFGFLGQIEGECHAIFGRTRGPCDKMLHPTGTFQTLSFGGQRGERLGRHHRAGAARASCGAAEDGHARRGRNATAAFHEITAKEPPRNRR